MTFHLYEDTWETSITTGTGDYVLGGAASGWRPFSAQYVDTNTTWYSAFDGINFEHGIGTYNSGPNTLSRTTVLRSTNGGNPVVWTSGVRHIVCATLGIGIEQIVNTPGTVVSATAPVSPKVGTLWFDTVGGQLYVWYDDGTSQQWVPATNRAGSAALGSSNNVGRNLIHNPLFNVAQRGAGPWTTTNTVTLDRWRLAFGNGSSSVTSAAVTDGSRAQIGDEAAENALVNAFTGSATAASFNLVYQSIEDVRRLAGKAITVSFWAAALAGTPKLGISLDQTFGTGGTPSAGVNGNGITITLSTTWTRYSVTLTPASVAGKTLGTDTNSTATSLNLWYSAEATFATRSGNVGVQSGTIFLWGIQLEIGSVATPLEKPDPQQDLAKCQRFYQAGTLALWGYGFNGNPFGYSQALNVLMRAAPTVGIGTPVTANVGTFSTLPYPTAIEVYGIPPATGFSGFRINFTASADL